MAQNCSHDRAYIMIIVSVLPLWAILTTLIVFALIAFHKSLRATKIYDNCTKQSAQFVYHIDLRTGDTSATYLRRKTTISIDMFDENQATLARVAIPGHVIFGRKDAPVNTVEDDRFFDLRITRLWLYRASKLRKVTTIRLTHTCLEPEARIMVYGVEIRSNDSERRQLFFPVMNYITAYGTVNRPNACFDSEPLGSISAMGGSQAEQSTISDQLSFVDYSLLVYLFCSFVFHFSTYDFLAGSFTDSAQASFKGAILGCCGYSITLIIGIALRYLIKHNYSLNIGVGVWAYIYYGANYCILIPATCLWIYTSFIAYNQLCTNEFSNWILTMSVAIIESCALALACALVSWSIQACSPSYTEQYVLPEEIGSIQNSKNRSSHQSQKLKVGSIQTGSTQPHHQQQQQHQQQHHQQHQPQQSWQMSGNNLPIQYMVPPGATGGALTLSPSPGQNAYTQSPYLANTVLTQTGGAGYKHYQPGGAGAGGAYHQPYPPYYVPPVSGGQLHAQSPPPPGAAGAHSPPQPAPTSPPTGTLILPKTYTDQVTTGIKTVKRVGSAESTGSTYFQQLMKNKGSVKSISQYGELMKAKKPKK